jgi:hypothetical protein
MNKIFALTTLAATSLALAGCELPENSDSIQNHKQEQLSKAAVQAVGLPAIVNFQEKRILKDILELRDRSDLRTYTYVTDMNGRLHKRCDSIGYGIPYATQFTNPEKIAESFQSGYAIMPQADPNGLFSPASADGTWVLCKVPGSDKVSPAFFEDRVAVSTFPLENN